jgi:hypothetical protein
MKFGFPCVGAAHETTGSNATASNAGNTATIGVAIRRAPVCACIPHSAHESQSQGPHAFLFSSTAARVNVGRE